MMDEAIREMAVTLESFVKKSTVGDFLVLSKAFCNPKYNLLIKKALDAESRILLAGAKNKELFYNLMEWSRKTGYIKASTLSDRKRYLLDVGLISEKAKKAKRGRPRKCLYMSPENIENFEQVFGRDIFR